MFSCLLIYTSNKKLYETYKNDIELYYKPPRCTRNISKNLEAKNIVSDYFAFNKYHSIIGDYGLNVYNIYTAYFLYSLGLTSITLSVELTENEMLEFINSYKEKFNTYPNIEILNYGLIENMIIKDNVLNIKEDDYNYELYDIKNRHFPVYYDEENTHILNYKLKESINNKLLKDKVTIRYDFYKETSKEISKILSTK